jgi:hypothetical protein
MLVAAIAPGIAVGDRFAGWAGERMGSSLGSSCFSGKTLLLSCTKSKVAISTLTLLEPFWCHHKGPGGFPIDIMEFVI